MRTRRWNSRISCALVTGSSRGIGYGIAAALAGAGAQIILNGATALLGKPGDRLTIMNFAAVDAAEAKSWKPRVIVLGEDNSIVK